MIERESERTKKKEYVSQKKKKTIGGQKGPKFAVKNWLKKKKNQKTKKKRANTAHQGQNLSGGFR